MANELTIQSMATLAELKQSAGETPADGEYRANQKQ
jgi:hypothetical protein